LLEPILLRSRKLRSFASAINNNKYPNVFTQYLQL
jgi:hypothetical protein